jgi:hypothetical protein
LAHTTAEDYFRRFAEVIKALRQRGVDVPIFVAIETGYCDGRWTPPDPNNPIAEAQRRVIAAHDGLYFGADMDAALNSASDRYDGCHMSRTGARKFARLWTQAIAAPMPVTQPRSEPHLSFAEPDGQGPPQGPEETAPRLLLDQQSNEADKQGAAKHHGPVPDINRKAGLRPSQVRTA